MSGVGKSLFQFASDNDFKEGMKSIWRCGYIVEMEYCFELTAISMKDLVKSVSGLQDFQRGEDEDDRGVIEMEVVGLEIEVGG